MIFNKTKLKDVYIIEPQKSEDERGFFNRLWDKKEFEQLGLDSNFVQCSISFNRMKGTLRGMHYQVTPYEETKLVLCKKGRMYDVVIDLRPNSETFMKWEGLDINSESYKMLYIPKGFAHGFQTLEDDTEVLYQISEYYMPDYARGIRWNDRSFGITWPLTPILISIKDQSFSDFSNRMR